MGEECPAMGRRGSLTTLVALAVLIGTLVTATAPAGAATPDPERYAFCKINEERRSRGLAPLAWHGPLADSARRWSGHLAATGSLAHDPDLRAAVSALIAGVLHAAENVGHSPDGSHDLQDLFATSASHLQNQLRSDANLVGVGVVRDGAGGLWMTQRFVTGPAVAAPDTCAEGSLPYAPAPAPPPGRTPFVDVAGGAPYEAAVAWALERGITTGTTATTFSPQHPVTRGQGASFAWRAAGRPGSTATPYADVDPAAHAAPATTWLRGLDAGVGCTTTRFCPARAATRAEMVVILWTAAGAPQVDAPHGFADVPPGAPYSAAVAWAVAEGVTTGTSSATFLPDDPVTRAQAVTFLWRQR
jgi:uncharacterized protein YkwD